MVYKMNDDERENYRNRYGDNKIEKYCKRCLEVTPHWKLKTICLVCGVYNK